MLTGVVGLRCYGLPRPYYGAELKSSVDSLCLSALYGQTDGLLPWRCRADAESSSRRGDNVTRLLIRRCSQRRAPQHQPVTSAAI